jgi:hypothetical protein
MVIDYPPVFINTYLSEKISESLPDYFDGSVRFFPTQPSTIDALTEQSPEDSDEPFAVYDRMFRMRRKAFPHIRTEQLLYYFYKTAGGIEPLVQTIQKVQDLLDNGDESAEDLNTWIGQKLQSSPGTIVDGYQTVRFGAGANARDFYMPYFHETKIYQLEEARDIINFGTARTYAGNKVIIDYDWHKSGPA